LLDSNVTFLAISDRNARLTLCDRYKAMYYQAYIRSCVSLCWHRSVLLWAELVYLYYVSAFMFVYLLAISWIMHWVSLFLYKNPCNNVFNLSKVVFIALNIKESTRVTSRQMHCAKIIYIVLQPSERLF